MTASGNLVEN